MFYAVFEDVEIHTERKDKRIRYSNKGSNFFLMTQDYFELKMLFTLDSMHKSLISNLKGRCFM